LTETCQFWKPSAADGDAGSKEAGQTALIQGNEFGCRQWQWKQAGTRFVLRDRHAVRLACNWLMAHLAHNWHATPLAHHWPRLEPRWSGWGWQVICCCVAAGSQSACSPPVDPGEGEARRWGGV
jgi:hypothetical protein